MNINIQQPIAIHELGKRQNQEDSIYPQIGLATTNDKMFLVCDGMGGHEKGEVASNLVCTVLTDYIKNRLNSEDIFTDELFKEAMEAVYAQLDGADTGGFKKMGTTLTFLCFHRGGCTVAHIGDSRIYHIRPNERRILYKSRDHSLVYDLYQAGEITFEEMKTSPQKNVITRAIMPGKDNRVKADITHITDIQPGDCFYLCSDGMLEQMEDSELVSLLSGKGSDEKKRTQLLAASMENSDNHSAYLIYINDVRCDDNDSNLVNDEADVAWNVANDYLNIEDANEVSIVDIPAPPKNNSPVVKTKVGTKKKQRNLSYLTYLAAAVAIAICFFAYGIIKNRHSRPYVEKSDNWNVPDNRTNGSKIVPIHRSGPSSNKVNNKVSKKDADKKQNVVDKKSSSGPHPATVKASEVKESQDNGEVSNKNETSAGKAKDRIDDIIKKRTEGNKGQEKTEGNKGQEDNDNDANKIEENNQKGNEQ